MYAACVSACQALTCVTSESALCEVCEAPCACNGRWCVKEIQRRDTIAQVEVCYSE